MKIISYNEHAHLGEIEFHLHSVDTHLRYHMLTSTVYPPPEMDRNHRAVITFDDSREVDLLIHMLEQFKKESISRLGYWD